MDDDLIGRRLGPYEVRELLGSGGMGTVYEAFDVRLARAVALKFVANRGSGKESYERLGREAEALAAITHPNIVAVFEVGRADDGLYVAMELVEGPTLLTWLKRDHTLAERLAVMRQAGLGLAAAHARGIVHRDFKPANVMVGLDGRVRVLDFGLARALAGVSESSDPQALETTRSDRETPLTQKGTVVGTPAYMAPEQLRGAKATAAADQFAFCLTLYEVLEGRRPFRDRPGVEVLRGRPLQLRWSKATPKRLRQLIARGLNVHPTGRFASMEELLEGLEPRRSPLRWVELAAAAAGGVAVLLALSGDPPCGPGPGVWDADRQQAVQAAFVAAGVGDAQRQWDRTRAVLDDHAARWEAAYGEVCEEADAGAAHDQRMVCLSGVRKRFAALVDALTTADAGSVYGAVPAALQLPAPRWCRVDATASAAALPEALRVRVQALDAEISAVRAFEDLGRFDDAVRRAAAAVESARAVGHDPTLAAALVAQGRVHRALSRYAEGRAAMEEGFEIARGARADALAATTAVSLANLFVADLGRPAEAQAWIRHAQATMPPDAPPTAVAELAVAQARIHVTRSEYDAARERLQFAASLVQAQGDGAQVQMLSSLEMLGGVAEELEDYDDALAYYERVLAIEEGLLGPAHPRVGHTLLNIGNVHSQRANYGEARARYRDAERIARAAFGDTHPDVARAKLDLAIVEEAEGNLQLARELGTQAQQIVAATLGDDHPTMGSVLLALAATEHRDRKFDRAVELLHRAKGLYEGLYGAEHKMVAAVLGRLGAAHSANGKVTLAEATLHEALVMQRAALGPESATVAGLLGNLAVLAVRRGQYDEGERLLLEALPIFERVNGPDHPSVARTYFNLGLVATDLEAPERARRYWQTSVRLIEQRRGLQHPHLGGALTWLGRLERKQGNADLAVELLSRAVDVRRAGNTRPDDLAESLAELSKARIAAGHNRKQALALAKEADALRQAQGS